MKKKLKGVTIWIGVLALIVIVCFVILLFPSVSGAVAKWTGSTVEKVKSVTMAVAGSTVGLLLISFGVSAIAAAPIVGAALVIVGLAMLVYSAWPMFVSQKPANTQLNNMQ